MHQDFSDVTFIFGAPESVSESNMYDFIRKVASDRQTSFTEEYKSYLREALVTQKLFNEILTNLCQKDVFIGKHFIGEVNQSKKTNQNEMFFEDNETSAKIPTITIYPPDFVLENGEAIDVQISEDSIKLISSVLGQALRLDWIRFISKENKPLIEI